MKTAIFQFYIGDPGPQRFAMETVQNYCRKYGISYFLSSQALINGPHLMFEKLQGLSLIKNGEFDRVLYMDTDILVTPHAKNIFEEYPDQDYFYAYDENDHSLPFMNRDGNIPPNLEWPMNSRGVKRYFNAGVMLWSRPFIDKLLTNINFKDIPDWPPMQRDGDQAMMNYWLTKSDIPFKTMDYSFNRMDLGNVDPECKRYSANFIHYAGRGYAGSSSNRNDVLANDYGYFYGGFGLNETVKIDHAHAALITGLVVSSKPKEVLEIGLGGGRSCDAIISGMEFNNNGANLTIVDNWYDFNGRMPKIIDELYGEKAKIITSDEVNFIFTTTSKYDFIVSDADHHNTQKWFEYVYNNILRDEGILIYHDINLFEDTFANLREIHKKCLEKNYAHYLFNKNSRQDERCHRGLLVIFKNKKDLQHAPE